MDDSVKPAQSAGLPQGPHFAGPAPAALKRLRLLMEPGGMAIELKQADVLVGRHSEADIRLPLPDVSRKHCRFQFIDGNWQVLDLKSLNGVFVNDQRVEHAVLHHDDRVRLGSFTFVVEMEQAAAAPAEASLAGLAEALFKERASVHAILPPPRRAS